MPLNGLLHSAGNSFFFLMAAAKLTMSPAPSMLPEKLSWCIHSDEFSSRWMLTGL